MNDIQHQAEKMLGPPLRLEAHRGWEIFACPFCAGHNLGIYIQDGHWKCLTCDAAGPNLKALQHRLERPLPSSSTPDSGSSLPPISRINEALTQGRESLCNSQAAGEYLSSLGIRKPTILTYALGYGLSSPTVDQATQSAAYKAMLMESHGYWLWAGGVVYADPPTNPALVQVRHLRPQTGMKYQTWGRMLRPLGAWRVNRSTRRVLVVKDMETMLLLAQGLHDRHCTDTLPICTGGITAPYAMTQWFASNVYEYVLIPDPGDIDWARPIVKAIRRCEGSQVRGVWAPDNQYPADAILNGWWPEGLKFAQNSL